MAEEKRIFYGYSNGVGFGINLLNKKPEIFKTYICLSPAGSDIQNLIWNEKIDYPKIIVRYGNEESEYFLNEAKNVKNSLSKIIKDFEIVDGTHEEDSWIKQCAEILSNNFKL